MRTQYKIVTLLFIMSFLGISAAEVIDEIVAVVGNVPVTSIQLEKEKADFLKRKKKGKQFNIKTDRRPIESQVLDLLISRAIVDLVAEEESVTVPPERVDSAIKKEMEARGIKDEKQYRKMIERQLGMPYHKYRQELARQIKTQQVVQLRVSVPNPTPSQVENWYRLNKSKIGNKYFIRLIVKRFKKGDTKDEIRVNRIMNQARALALRNFPAAAKKYSEHVSRKRGGLVGWVRLDQLAQMDPVLAGLVNATPPGRVSRVVASGNQYLLVKVERTAPIPLDEVYDQIRMILYRQNEEAAFVKWVQDQRKNIAVKIFLKDYKEL